MNASHPFRLGRQGSKAYLGLCISAALFAGNSFAATVDVATGAAYSGAVSGAGAGDTIRLTSSLPYVITATGVASAGGLTLSSDGNAITRNLLGSGFQIFQTGFDLANVSDIGFTNGVSLGNGAAIEITGTNNLTGGITNAGFVGNSATTGGGAVYVGGDIGGSITNTLFSGNDTAGGHGGAVYVGGDLVGSVLGNSSFVSNKIVSGAGNGGALYVGGDMGGSITGTSFALNETFNGNGGAVYINGDMNGNIDGGAIFQGNQAQGATAQGGALFVNGVMNGRIVDSEFRGNTSVLSGGAVEILASPHVQINNSAFIANAATGAASYGGALSVQAAQVSLVNSDFVLNLAGTGRGGGLYYDAGGVDALLNVEAGAGNSSLFMSNTNGAIHLTNVGATSAATVNIRADGNVYMFDPLTIADNTTSVVNKTGAGTWYLGGANATSSTATGFNSTWNINQGIFALMNSTTLNLTTFDATGNFNLGANATLSGGHASTITADNIQLDGIIDPKQLTVDPGFAALVIPTVPAATLKNVTFNPLDPVEGTLTLNATGNVNFGAGSIYKVDVNVGGGNKDLINVTGGTLVIDPAAVLVVNPTSGPWLPLQTSGPTSVLNDVGGAVGAGGVGNNFQTVLAPLFYNADVVASTTTDVNLTVTRNSDDFDDYAVTYNQNSVADELVAMTETVGIAQVIATNTYSASEAQAAYDAVSGEIHASTRAALLGDRHLRNVVGQRVQKREQLRLASLPSLYAASGSTAYGSGAGADSQSWVSGWGFGGKLDGDGNAAATDYSGGGFAVGGESIIGEGLLAGVLIGYENGQIKNSKGRSSKVDVAGYSLGGYLAAEVQGFELSSGLTYTRLSLESKRHVRINSAVGSVDLGKAKADYDANKVQFFAEAAKPFAFNDDLSVSPYLNLAQTWLKSDGATEKNAGVANLRVKSNSSSLTQTTLGVRPTLQLPGSLPVTLTADLGWVHSFGDTDSEADNRFVTGGTQDFRVKGASLDKNAALVGAGVQLHPGEGAVLGVGYQGQLGSDYKDHSGQLQLRIAF